MKCQVKDCVNQAAWIRLGLTPAFFCDAHKLDAEQIAKVVQFTIAFCYRRLPDDRSWNTRTNLIA